MGRINLTTIDWSATQLVFSLQLLARIMQTTEVRIKMKTTILRNINKLADGEHFHPHMLQGGHFSLAKLKTISLARFWETGFACSCILSETVRLKFIFVHLEVNCTYFWSWKDHTWKDLKKIRSTTFRKQ